MLKDSDGEDRPSQAADTSSSSAHAHIEVRASWTKGRFGVESKVTSGLPASRTKFGLPDKQQAAARLKALITRTWNVRALRFNPSESS